jgi:hypothetical protein
MLTFYAFEIDFNFSLLTTYASVFQSKHLHSLFPAKTLEKRLITLNFNIFGSIRVIFPQRPDVASN